MAPNPANLDYPPALKLGLPIGSGMIESGPRHVLHARLKKAGAAWLADSADQIAQLLVLRANQLWESFLELTSPTFNHTPGLTMAAHRTLIYHAI